LTSNRPLAADDDFDDATAVFGPDSRNIKSSAQSGENPCHVLICMDGSEIGKVIRLSRDQQFVIGRRQDCDLVLKYEGVSRQHARLIYDSGAFILEDLGSSNGTLVQGEPIARQRLNDGDVLQLGPMVNVRYSITDLHEEQMLRQLYEAAVRDSLTGAYNREYLSECLRSEVAFATRHGGQTSLIMFDLDHFKRVNDTFGHLAGDAVLIEVVERVRQDLRTEDVMARYGGEEFAISMRAVGLQGAKHVAERIRLANHRVVNFQGHQIPVSISVGCSDLNDCTEKTPEALIAVADRRLYAAKGAGRNCVVASG
jgi:two-component system, cell cycle response regulator